MAPLNNSIIIKSKHTHTFAKQTLKTPIHNATRTRSNRTTVKKITPTTAAAITTTERNNKFVPISFTLADSVLHDDGRQNKNACVRINNHFNKIILNVYYYRVDVFVLFLSLSPSLVWCVGTPICLTLWERKARFFASIMKSIIISITIWMCLDCVLQKIDVLRSVCWLSCCYDYYCSRAGTLVHLTKRFDVASTEKTRFFSYSLITTIFSLTPLSRSLSFHCSIPCSVLSFCRLILLCIFLGQLCSCRWRKLIEIKAAIFKSWWKSS